MIVMMMMMMMMMVVVMLLRAFEPPGLASAFPRERLYELASAKFDSTFFAISASSRVFECVHTHALAIAFYNRMLDCGIIAVCGHEGHRGTCNISISRRALWHDKYRSTISVIAGSRVGSAGCPAAEGCTLVCDAVRCIDHTHTH